MSAPSYRDLDVDPSTSTVPWALVLAAGQGQRLAPLTRALYGRDVPKQFAALDGERTLLQQTIDRTRTLTSDERTVVVVANEQGNIARRQLGRHSGAVIEQPRNVGTLPGLLLPLAHILEADPKARVVVYPADHHISRNEAFCDAVRRSVEAIDRTRARTVLVGARADRAATDLGWILPGHALWGAGPRAVECFVEKPNAAAAQNFFQAGALWNTLIFAFEACSFWQEALHMCPSLVRPFETYRDAVGTPQEASVRREIYEHLPTLDLSRDLLAKRPGLAVVEMGDAGWSDCGTPERLFECLEGDGQLEWFLRRLEARPTGELGGELD